MLGWRAGPPPLDNAPVHPVLVVVLVTVASVAVGRALARANELFALTARQGRVMLLRGRLPRALESELTAVLRDGRATGLLRAVRQGGQTRLVGEGLEGTVEQKLRNVFFASRYASMRWLAARDPRARNLGQRLGWEWLAWRLAGTSKTGALRTVPEEERNGPLQ